MERSTSCQQHTPPLSNSSQLAQYRGQDQAQRHGRGSVMANSITVIVSCLSNFILSKLTESVSIPTL
jgi:hypothetical protein